MWVLCLPLASEDGLLGSSSSTLTTLEKEQFAAAIQKFGMNLPSILETVKKLAPKANIVLYNLYDPSPSSSSLHALAEQMVTPENQIISEVAPKLGLSVVDRIPHHKKVGLGIVWGSSSFWGASHNQSFPIFLGKLFSWSGNGLRPKKTREQVTTYVTGSSKVSTQWLLENVDIDVKKRF